MSAPSPNDAEPDDLQLTITSNGAALDSAWQLGSVDIWLAAQKIPRARIECYDGGPDIEDFPISKSDALIPGAKVKIQAGYGAAKQVLFEGIVVRHGLEIARGRNPRVVIDLASEAVKMTLARRSALYEESSDDTMIGKLIAAYGLTKDIDSIADVQETIQQGFATDWDMMVARAETNGLLVLVEGSKVTVKAPDTSASPVLTLTYGESILDLDVQLDAPSQLAAGAFRSTAWDSATQTILEATPQGEGITEAGNLSSATLAEVCGVATSVRQTAASLSADDLQAWSKAERLRAQLAKIRGSVRFQGTALAKPGVMVTLAGVGPRFNGPVFIGAVYHQIRDNRWQTTATLGLDPAPLTDVRPTVTAPPAAGQLPGVRGLQIGIVKQVAPDPKEGFRVQVTLPLLEDSEKAIWARLATPYASSGFGLIFFPEIGDEVLLGYLNEDPRYPVLLASLYSKTRKPTYPPQAANDTKAIVTRTCMEIKFDEKDKIITIRTPGKQTITLDDKATAITLADSNSNIVTLDPKGIKLDSATDIQLIAKGDISLKATGNVKLKADANATLNALGVTLQATQQFSAQGTASAEVKASGVLTLQGALVKIN